jgi:hypothetical protein
MGRERKKGGRNFNTRDEALSENLAVAVLENNDFHSQHKRKRKSRIIDYLTLADKAELATLMQNVPNTMLQCKNVILRNFTNFRQFNLTISKPLCDCGFIDFLLDQLNKVLIGRTRYQSFHHILSNFDYDRLTHCGEKKLVLFAQSLHAVVREIKTMHIYGDSIDFTRIVDQACELHRYDPKGLIDVLKQLMFDNGLIGHSIRLKRHDSWSIISDEKVQLELRRWMSEACKAKPPAKAEQFRDHVERHYNCKISVRTAQIWLHRLGFSYGKVGGLAIYLDGQQRPDVKQALVEHIVFMKKIEPYTRRYYGPQMDQVIEPTKLLQNRDGSLVRIEVFYHDEASSQSKESDPNCWSIKNVTTGMREKRGEAAMVAAYISSSFGT